MVFRHSTIHLLLAFTCRTRGRSSAVMAEHKVENALYCCPWVENEPGRVGRCKLFSETLAHCPHVECPVACGTCKMCFDNPSHHIYWKLYSKRSSRQRRAVGPAAIIEAPMSNKTQAEVLTKQRAVIKVINFGGSVRVQNPALRCCPMREMEPGRERRCKWDAASQVPCPKLDCPIACGTCKMCLAHPRHQLYMTLYLEWWNGTELAVIEVPHGNNSAEAQAAAAVLPRDVQLQVFAAYWPQWHATPLNDYWFADGYTDWTLLCKRLNVGNSTKRGKNRIKERLVTPLRPPHGLGWYNLTDRGVRRRQALLAKEHGLYGFAIYHYWFARDVKWGKPRSWGSADFGADMDETLLLMLEDGEPDIPFYFVWANEPWRWKWRTWKVGQVGELADGADQIPMVYPEPTWRPHFDYLLRFFRHRNYHRIDGMPVLGLHSLEAVPPATMLESFRRWAKDAGFPGLFIIQMYHLKTGHTYKGIPLYQDMARRTNFAPWADGVQDFGWRTEFGDRRKAAPALHENWTAGIITDFDNTPRMGVVKALIGKKLPYQGGPPSFEDGLEKVVTQSMERALAARRRRAMLFVVSWNEWSEQAALEPSDRYGTGYLEALRRVLQKHGQYRYEGPVGLWRTEPQDPSAQLSDCQYGLNATPPFGWPEREGRSPRIRIPSGSHTSAASQNNSQRCRQQACPRPAQNSERS